MSRASARTTRHAGLSLSSSALEHPIMHAPLQPAATARTAPAGSSTLPQHQQPCCVPCLRATPLHLEHGPVVQIGEGGDGADEHLAVVLHLGDHGVAGQVQAPEESSGAGVEVMHRIRAGAGTLACAPRCSSWLQHQLMRPICGWACSCACTRSPLCPGAASGAAFRLSRQAHPTHLKLGMHLPA